MIRQSELKKYLELKDQVKNLDKSLKERAKSNEKIQAGLLTVSVDSTTSYNPSWKEIALDAARTFKMNDDDGAFGILQSSFDKLSQAHQTAPALRIENHVQKTARIEKSDTPRPKKELEEYL